CRNRLVGTQGRTRSPATRPNAPLTSESNGVLEKTALPDLQFDGVSVDDFQPPDRRLASPAPNVVRVGIPDDLQRGGHRGARTPQRAVGIILVGIQTSE